MSGAPNQEMQDGPLVVRRGRVSHSFHARIAVWFAVVVAALIFCGYLGYQRLSTLIQGEASEEMNAKLQHIDDVLSASASVYTKFGNMAMRALKESAARRGPPVRVCVSGKPPTLYFGADPVTPDDELIGGVMGLMGGQATVFVREGDDFVRVATNLPDRDGDRAVGTYLDRADEPLAYLLRGEPYAGPVEIMGKAYLGSYEPVKDADGEVIGALFVGYPVRELAILKDSIENDVVLRRGLFALADSKGHVIFASKSAQNTPLEAIIDAAFSRSDPPPGWMVRSEVFVPWRYMIVAALRQEDIFLITLDVLWQVYGIEGAILIAILIVSYILARKLSDARDEAEQSRVEAESASRTKSAFLASMSHELRTPMNAIIGYTEMLREDARETDHPAAQDLNKIHSAATHLLSLINDVLDVSKIEAGKITVHFEKFALDDLLREVADTIAPLVSKNGNTFELEGGADPGTMDSDYSKLRQILLNLLGNAGKFTENGQITLAVRDESAGRVCFEIRDTGIGMDAAQLSRLFRAFSQGGGEISKKYGGTGLGLVISQSYARMLGGEIAVSSQPGRGSTFRLTLPRSAPRAERPAMLP